MSAWLHYYYDTGTYEVEVDDDDDDINDDDDYDDDEEEEEPLASMHSVVKWNESETFLVTN